MSEETSSPLLDQSPQRRSANYKPNIWKCHLLQSLTTDYHEEKYETHAQKLKEDVKRIFAETLDLLAKLELIDSIGKLGLRNLFEEEIKNALDSIVSMKNNHLSRKDDLYATALWFRLLRQHGYSVSQGVFAGFMGKFMKSTPSNVKATLELFEASHLAFEGENILHEAKNFTSGILNSISLNIDDKLAKQVCDALELPLHWRVGWWWTDLTDSTESLSFARNRIVESYLWAVGVAFEPQYGSFRKWLAKVIKLIIVIDDVYDVYGTLQELEHFTTVVRRWDTEETNKLPECMLICFQTLCEITNEIASDIKKEREAKWYSKHYTPSLQEYLHNGWMSSSGTVLSLHAFIFVTPEVAADGTFFLKNVQDLVYSTSLIIRLCNDLGTSAAELERGDSPSSILCYMQEARVSEEHTDRFEEAVKDALNTIGLSFKNNGLSIQDDLYATALCFRLLRRPGYNVAQDMFRGFMDKMDRFKQRENLNVKAVLELFQALNLSVEGESMLVEARNFATEHLKLIDLNLDDKLAIQIAPALELPWRCQVEGANEEKYETHAKKLKDDVKCIFLETVKSLANLELIDSIGKLGLATIFDEEIKDALDTVVLSIQNNKLSLEEDLYATSLCFRMLRQHGYSVSQDIFKCFLDDLGKFNRSANLDVKAVLELFEASNMSLEGENIMEAARIFSVGHLKNIRSNFDDRLAKQAAQVLDLPLFCRVEWYNVRRHINLYEREDHRNPSLLELAKLNFNVIQATHQKDLRELSRNHSALLVEAKWYNQGYTPSLQEYLDNGWISSSGPVLSLHAFFSATLEPTEELIELHKSSQDDLVYYTSLIIRLCNDQGTSAAELERGDASSSILCYMKEANVSEEVARDHIRSIIMQTWKNVSNQFLIQPPSLQPFAKCTVNIARVAQFIYQNGDGFGVQDRETRDHVLSMLIEPLAVR
ncbi:hypothetical protein RJ640_005464 [Escallonia rubra]|uniref:Alpha-farnesene synthase n=1 Tax=Escallonia rubra TaxID=112253 RepID=A0AA88RKL2_9ASTE|nr:hypothetical protein RJ640_005464 [Escallonia rubra]